MFVFSQDLYTGYSNTRNIQKPFVWGSYKKWSGYSLNYLITIKWPPFNGIKIIWAIWFSNGIKKTEHLATLDLSYTGHFQYSDPH